MCAGLVLRDYGLTQISLSPEGKEASIGMLQETIDDAKAHDAKVMFFQKDIDSWRYTCCSLSCVR